MEQLVLKQINLITLLKIKKFLILINLIMKT